MPQSVKPTACNPISTSFDIEEQAHFSHFDNVAGHIKDLGNVYLSKIAGTSASTGGYGKGFALNQGAA